VLWLTTFTDSVKQVWFQTVWLPREGRPDVVSTPTHWMAGIGNPLGVTKRTPDLELPFQCSTHVACPGDSREMRV
jgi:hypothetical protein